MATLLENIRKIYKQRFNDGTERLHRDVLLAMAGGESVGVEIDIDSNVVQYDGWKGLTIAQIKKNFTLYADGSELLSRSQTIIEDSAAGSVNLQTTAFVGQTAYLK